MTETTDQTTIRRRRAINHLLMSDPAMVCAVIQAIEESDKEAAMILIGHNFYSELLSKSAQTSGDDVAGD